MGAHAYAVTNKLAGLAASAFTWSNSYAGADKILVNDARMDKRVSIGSIASGANVIINLGSAMAINGVAILNHNLVTASGAAVTMKVEGAADVGMSSALVEAKAVSTLGSYNSFNSRDPMNKDHVLQFATVTKQYWRLTFTWTGTIDPTFGEIFFYASPSTLTRKGIYGSGDGERMFTSRVQFGNGGSRGMFFGGPLRHKKLSWADLSNTEKNELRVLWYSGAGNAGSLLFVNSYEAVATAAASTEQECIYGYLGDRDSIDYPELDYSLYGMDDFAVVSHGREVGA